ncbi:MAG: hypothetical protein BWY08_01829 [Bacteroidetes bacterium ADurb.Bin174]|nr:MAG: hypothetical protein BWY08_01829 [Bacteroidetes bacterium ADurb.Bin174]
MKTKLLLLSCAVLLFAGPSFAEISEKIYSGGTLPTEQGWTELKLDATINDVAAPTTLTAGSGVLKLTSNNAADQFSQLMWYKTGLNLNLNTGYTIEIKAKVTAADKTAAFNVQGYDRDGKGFRIGILKNAVTELTNPFAATNVVANELTNDDAFHVFRFAFAPTGTATVYRDGVEIGTFPISSFRFDNSIENGGFEDAEFPDFKSNGILTRLEKNDDLSNLNNYNKVRYGNYALEMYNNGLVTNDWSNIEGASTRQIAVKPNTDYELSITRRRTLSEPWCWRDMGAFYDFQKGTLDGEDKRDQNVTWGGFDRMWQTHAHNFTTPAEAKTVRLEFPTWRRDGTKDQNTCSFDNITLREKLPVSYGVPVTVQHGLPEPVFHDGYVNLIANGGFEDWEMNNDGTPYTWALSDPAQQGGNTPYAANTLWNTNTIRIQRSPQGNDEVYDDFARSGSASIRFTTDGNKNNNFDFAKELEANKTYRFNFWHRSPKWDDWGWLKVKIGENVIWSHELKGRNNVWANCDLFFTTTEENKTLHLYTTSEDHGDWWNLYLDDLVLYEVTGAIDPVIEGKTNLIVNGGFEDTTIDNEGNPYQWALASERTENDINYPIKHSDIWGNVVRIQDKQKHIDTGKNWAHSGNNSLRVSYLDNWNEGQIFEFGELKGAVQPKAYQSNINFTKELEPNKTYTFVFWLKAANYPDRGKLAIANGDVRLWDEQLSTKYINWTRQQITFSTNAAHHTLRMFTEFSGWFNFYLDDLFLFEEAEYDAGLAPATTGESFIAFGKSTGASSTNAEIEYLALDNTGAYAPDEKIIVHTENAVISNTRVYSNNRQLVVSTANPAVVSIYNTLGMLIETVQVNGRKAFELPAGAYIVKSVTANGKTDTIKALNR